LKYVAATLGIIWLFAVTFNYYIVHKPFTAENALAILNALGDVLVTGALFALAAALGRRVTRDVTFAAPLEALVLQTGLGLGLISFATLALGLVGALNRVLFWLSLLVAAFWLRDDSRAAWRDLRAIQLPLASRFERGLAVFCAVSLTLAFLLALTPPLGWDALQYHLVAPKLAMTLGRIAPPPDNVGLSYPSLVEMLFLAAMLLKGDVAAQLLHFGFLLLGLGALFALASRYFNSIVAWLACAILVAAPSLLTVSTWAYVDLALAFYATAAFFALMCARETDDARWFALSGALAGMALGVKYTGAIVPLALFVLLLLVRSNLSFVIRHLSFVILFAAPWYIRNLVFTGNPVYPFLFGGRYWDAFRASWFTRLGSGLLNTPLQLLTAPWEATILGREGTEVYDATIGPLLLALAPLLVLVAMRKREEDKGVLRAAAVFSLILYAFWLLNIVQSKLLIQTRLLFPAFPLFALLAASAFDRLSALDFPQFSLQRFTRLLIGLVLGLTALGYALGFASDSPLRYLAGFETREQYLARHLGAHYAAARFVNANLLASARVLFLWEPRSYYFARAAQPDVLLDVIPRSRWQYRDADATAVAWRSAGYTHVLLHRVGLDFMLRTGYDPITPDDVQMLQDVVARHLKQVYGRTALQIGACDGKMCVVGAADEPYAIYEVVP
jgi:4-amino-4-deoxy-L-arabinose transferase-like glycosyltransferase